MICWQWTFLNNVCTSQTLASPKGEERLALMLSSGISGRIGSNLETTAAPIKGALPLGSCNFNPFWLFSFAQTELAVTLLEYSVRVTNLPYLQYFLNKRCRHVEQLWAVYENLRFTEMNEITLIVAFVDRSLDHYKQIWIHFASQV